LRFKLIKIKDVKYIGTDWKTEELDVENDFWILGKDILI